MTLRQLIATGVFAGLIATSAQAARAAEPILLKFAYPGPLKSWPATKGVAPWASKIKAASDGLVEIKIFPGIASYRNVYDRILNGVADFGFGTFGSLERQFPHTSVTGLPFVADNSVETGLAIWRLYASGVIADEYTRVKPIAMFGFGTSAIFLSQPITKFDDLKGMKIFANGRSVGRIVTLIGAVPITSNPAALFEGLSRGLAQGAVFSWSGIMQFKLEKLVHGAVNVPFGRTGGYFMMNKQSFAKLPAKAQQAIDKYSGDDLSRLMGKESDNQDDAARAKLVADSGHFKNMELTPAELKKLRQVLAPVTDEWVAAVPDGAKVLAAFEAEVARIRKQ
jgi:TRAP-type C4-dicarboxylate transport system substrate-binding protein